MSIINTYLKLRRNGLIWLFLRCKRELINPSNNRLAKVIDFILLARLKLFSSKKIKVNNYLCGIYDLEVAPITFNIAEYLCCIEIEARQRRKNGFYIVIVPKKTKQPIFENEYEKIIDIESSTWRINNILVQTAQLHPDCRGISVLPDRSGINKVIKDEEIYPTLYDGKNLRYANLKEFYGKVRKPGDFLGLRAPEQGKRYIRSYIENNKITKKIITIVIRQYDYDPARNSNLAEWSKFVDYLVDNDYHPIIVPDTNNAFNCELPFDKKYIFSDCCWNIALRMALYEMAFLNFSVSGGAGAIMIYNPTCRFIYMNMHPKGSSVATDDAYKLLGFESHEKEKLWEFTTARQIISFKEDTFFNIKKEFNFYIKNI